MAIEQQQKRRVMVTGARGFVGWPCLDMLREKGYEIHCVSTNEIAPESVEDKWHQVDLLEPFAVQQLMQHVRPHMLLHLAWITTPGEFWRSTDNRKWVDASIHLLEQFARFNGERAVIAGACAEYDWTQGTCIEDDTPRNSKTLFGQSKSELWRKILANENLRTLSIAWGRIFFPYGPGEQEDKFIASSIRSMLQSRAARCDSADTRRDYIHIYDVASAMVQLLESDYNGAVNIASGESVSLGEILAHLAEALDCPKLVDIRHPDGAPQQDPMIAADVTRLHKEIGFKPNYDLQSGLKDSIEYWRNKLKEEHRNAQLSWDQEFV